MSARRFSKDEYSLWLAIKWEDEVDCLDDFMWPDLIPKKLSFNSAISSEAERNFRFGRELKIKGRPWCSIPTTNPEVEDGYIWQSKYGKA